MAQNKSLYHQFQDYALEDKIKEMEAEMPEYMRDYFLSLSLSRQKKTRIAYIRELNLFLKYLIEKNPSCKKLGVKEVPKEVLESLTFRDINEYMAYRKNGSGGGGKENGPAALQRMMCVLRGYFRYEVTHGNMTNDPTVGAQRPEKVHKKPIDRLSKDEVRTLLDGVERSDSGTEHSRVYTTKTQLRDTAILTLLLNAGLRISELAGLDIEDVNFFRGCVRVLRKGGDLEDVYINSNVEKALRDYINLERPQYTNSEADKPLFMSNRKMRMSIRAIQVMIQKYGESVLSKGDLHAHTFRKTFGSNLYEQSGDIRLVASILNHKSIDTTIKHYADISETHKASNRNIDLYGGGN